MDSMASDSPAQDSPRQSVDDGQSDDTRQEPQFGRALYDFTAGGDEEVTFLLQRKFLSLLCSASWVWPC